MPDYRLVRHRGKFAVAFTDESGDRKRISLGTDDKSVATARLKEFERYRKVSIEGKELTVATIYDAYVADREAAGKAAAPRMKDAWKRLKPSFSALPPMIVSEALCRDYAKARNKAGASNGTVHVELGYLRAALEFASRKQWIAKAPYVPLPPKPPPREHHLTRAQGSLLVKSAVRPHIRLFIILALMTAGRVSAILQLTWDRVDLVGRTIDLRDPTRDLTPKGRAKVPMNETAHRALSEARKWAMTDHVIEYGGRPVVSVKKGVAAAAERAGLVVTPHVLRHTAAVWMVESGIPISVVAQYLGHTNPAVTYRVYARYSPEHLQKAASTLELDLD